MAQRWRMPWEFGRATRISSSNGFGLPGSVLMVLLLAHHNVVESFLGYSPSLRASHMSHSNSRSLQTTTCRYYVGWLLVDAAPTRLGKGQALTHTWRKMAPRKPFPNCG